MASAGDIRAPSDTCSSLGVLREGYGLRGAE